MQARQLVPGLNVAIARPTDLGRLYPAYDAEARLLVIESRVLRQFPIGIDVDGRVIFDLDADRTLGAIELISPMQRWRVGPLPPWGGPTTAGDLVFSNDSVAHKSFHLPLSVTTNAAHTRVMIVFGEFAAAAKAIALSDRCLAYVQNSSLIGFDVDLRLVTGQHGGAAAGSTW